MTRPCGGAGRTLNPVTPYGQSFVTAYDASAVRLAWAPPDYGPAPTAFAVLARCGAQAPAPLLRLPGDFPGTVAAVSPPGMAQGVECRFAVRSRNLNYDSAAADWAVAPGGGYAASAELAEVLYGAPPGPCFPAPAAATDFNSAAGSRRSSSRFF